MKKLAACILIVILAINSCNWVEVPEVNVVTTLGELTTVSQRNFVVFSNSEAALYSSMAMQQVSGVNGRMLQIEQYRWLPEYFDQSWAICYLAVLSNLSSLIKLADENDLGKFSGLAKILMAHTLGIATDSWGDIPFSDSFESPTPVLRPRYDSQQAIYQKIFMLLDQGIQDMENHGSEFYPAEEDIFFKGSAQKWISYANFLKLRYTLQLEKVNGIDPVYHLLQKQMFNNPGEALVIDYNELKIQNPLNNLLSLFPDQIRASAFLVNLLTVANDPRLPVWFARNAQNQFAGSAPGAGNVNASRLSETISSISSKIILASYTEQMFIAAEVYFRKGMTGQAGTAFAQAVRSSLIDYNVLNEAWLQNYLANTPLTLENILLAKYTALFLQTQPWNDWKRTGIPALQAPAVNHTNGIIPLRFPYPLNELTHNANNVPANVTILTPVWWDRP